MIKYAVKYLKNTFVPLKGIKEGTEIENEALVLVRTEKGEDNAT